MGAVWVIGSLNTDRTWRVGCHPFVGQTVPGRRREEAAGGKGLNQAVAARRMGAEVVLVGSVGDDEGGRRLVATAVAEGIDVTRVATSAGSTGCALVVVADDGANTVIVDPGANAGLEVGELPIGPDDVVVAQLEVPAEAVRRAFEQAGEVGAKRVLNPSPVGEGMSLVADADLVVVNEPELTELTGAADPSEEGGGIEGRLRALSDGRRTVVVTRGADGVVGMGPDGTFELAGTRVRAVDTTGAGDCFLGVLAAGLAAGAPLADAAGLANRAAGLAVTRRGTVDAMPTAAEVSGAS